MQLELNKWAFHGNYESNWDKLEQGTINRKWWAMWFHYRWYRRAVTADLKPTNLGGFFKYKSSKIASGQSTLPEIYM